MDRCKRRYPSGIIFVSFFFLVHINDLADGLSSNAKLFPDDTSSFSAIHDVDTSANELNNDLHQINKWAFEWKMSLNPDLSKQAQEFIFSRKTKRNVLPQPALMTIYKAFVRPPLDYGDVIYNEAHNEAFDQKLESIQYNACLALSGAIRGSSREKLCQELGLEPLQSRRWYRKLSLFYKISKENKPVYFFNLIPTKISNYNTRNTDKITLVRTKHNFFKNSFFPSTVTEWNKPDPNLHSAASFNVFKKNVFKKKRDHLLIVFLIDTTAKESNNSQNYALV